MKIMGLKPVDFPSNQSIDPWSFRSMFLPDVPHGTKALTWKDEPLQAVLSWPYHGLLCIPMDDDQVSCTHLWFTYRHMLIHTWVTVNSIPFHFHSLPLHTSITLHYIYIYVYIYIYTYRERESWIYLVLRYYAIHGLPVSYDNYVQDMHLLFFHPRHGSPAKIKCLNASVRSLRSTSQRHHQRTELNLATPDMATWQHAPLVMVGISPTTGI